MPKMPMEYDGGLKVKSDTYSGTTSAYGTLILNTTRFVVAVSGNINVFIANRETSKVYLKFVSEKSVDNNMVVVTVNNSAVSGTYWYIEED